MCCSPSVAWLVAFRCLSHARLERTCSSWVFASSGLETGGVFSLAPLPAGPPCAKNGDARGKMENGL